MSFITTGDTNQLGGSGANSDATTDIPTREPGGMGTVSSTQSVPLRIQSNALEN